MKCDKDKLGRSTIKWPRNGPLFVKLYPSLAIESTNVLHVNHMFHLISNVKKSQNVFNVVAVADGSPDWSVKGVANFLSMGFCG